MDALNIVFILVSAFAGLTAYRYYKLDRKNAQLLREKEAALTDEKIKITELQSEIKLHQEREKDLELIEKKFTDQFENLSRKILKENADTLKKEGAESIETLIKPYKNSLDEFKKEFKTAQESHIRNHQDLKNEFVKLSDMNKRLSDDANNLTKALKMNPKLRGNWGETILETLLERSGLVKNYHYRREVSGATDEGNLRADVIIDLPERRNLVIDSKVSLNAYYDYVSSDDDQCEAMLQDHIVGIRKHIDTLNRKQYDKMYNINSPDIVFMFVPIEAGLMAALQADPELSSYAIERNILLVTNSTLFAMLNVVSQLWQRDKQYENAEKIAEVAGKLHDQVLRFVGELRKIGAWTAPKKCTTLPPGG